jgi:hypothetical protein
MAMPLLRASLTLCAAMVPSAGSGSEISAKAVQPMANPSEQLLSRLETIQIGDRASVAEALRLHFVLQSESGNFRYWTAKSADGNLHSYAMKE